MQKLVYLFELDSVRKSDTEILIGQQALYNEIVGNGNIVVLTYNQLVDSRSFFSLLDIPEYYDNLVKLFKSGAIRISQFGDTRTISQYLIDSCSMERSFIYSGWPLKSTQKRLLALIKRCLMFSDLNEINDYKEGIRTEDELLDLFTEVDSNMKQHKTKITVQQCRDIIENLFHLIKTVLRLSSIHTIYVNPKPDDEYAMSFDKYLHHAMRLTPSDNIALWNRAIDILCSDHMSGAKDRSDYHHAIRSLHSQNAEEGVAAYQYAEAIVDLCYNYQLEYSICNSSKHYNISEFRSDDAADWVTFSADFFSRLQQTWNTGNPDENYLLEESNSFDEYEPSSDFPDFTKAVHMVGYAKRPDEQEQDDVARYEYKLPEQKETRRRTLLGSIRKKVLISLIVFAFALLLEVGFELLQNWLDSVLSGISWINVNPWLWTLLCTAVEVLLLLGITEFLTSKLSKYIPGFLSLSDVLQEMHGLNRDEHSVISMFKNGYHTYVNANLTAVDNSEKYQKGMLIDFVRTGSIKKYLALRKSRINLFRNPTGCPYPLPEITDRKQENALVKCWLRLEELYGYDFGVVYNSRYNTMVVDPVVTLKKTKDRPFYPYERIVPTSGKDGVVMIPRYNGRFILIRQFRHAIREEQYSFPRGFAENGGGSNENAVRELQEELNVHEILAQKQLGRVAADSGLTSTQAYIFLIDLKDYDPQIGHEGITEAVSLTETELDEWISEGKINDSFTLSAWSLYKHKQQ